VRCARKRRRWEKIGERCQRSELLLRDALSNLFNFKFETATGVGLTQASAVSAVHPVFVMFRTPRRLVFLIQPSDSLFREVQFRTCYI
jgi:hypothetical protein